MMGASSHSLRWLGLSAIMLIVDQLTKIWVAGSFTLYQSRPVTSFFNLVYVHNYGAAFSFLSRQGGWQRWLFSLLAVAVSLFLIGLLKRMRRSQPFTAAGYALIISGALGNVIDRFVHGYVIDFLDFYWDHYHWPAFNIADSCICVGAALLIWDSLTQPSKSSGERS
ncbi:signal peptidase II [Celerinatantimonas sp. YJH-8]|uniref:signal peptidase II n=1 Tax=Celerinatantimonas sp. YJH-8 TaxID=3228714 RepID=UPI0038C1C361